MFCWYPYLSRSQLNVQGESLLYSGCLRGSNIDGKEEGESGTPGRVQRYEEDIPSESALSLSVTTHNTNYETKLVTRPLDSPVQQQSKHSDCQ